MIIPEVVRIGSCYYDVEFTDDSIVVGSQVCYGAVDFDNHIIKLSSKLGDEQSQEQTFLHELVHAMVEERALDFKNDDMDFIVNELSKGLHQVILDNPHMFLEVEITESE
jgi:hypothetical protein